MYTSPFNCIWNPKTGMYVCMYGMFFCMYTLINEWSPSGYWFNLSFIAEERWMYVWMYVRVYVLCVYVLCVYVCIYVCMQAIVDLYFPFICECRLQGKFLINASPHIFTGQSHECRRFVVLMVNLVTRQDHLSSFLYKYFDIKIYMNTYIQKRKVLINT